MPHATEKTRAEGRGHLPERDAETSVGPGEGGAEWQESVAPSSHLGRVGEQLPEFLERETWIFVLSPPRLVSISLMLFTSSPNLSKEYDSHVFRFI